MAPSPSNESKIRSYARTLRLRCRPLLPVRVYFRSSLQGDDGVCSLNYSGERPTSFSIYIKRQSLAAMTDALVHEWAHCLSWQEGEDEPDDHCAVFGIMEARCYRALLREETVIETIPEPDESSAVMEITQLKSCDPSTVHAQADEILLEFLEEAGFEKLVEAYVDLQGECGSRWYD